MLLLQFDILCVFTNATQSSRNMIKCQTVVNSSFKRRLNTIENHMGATEAAP